MEKLKSLIPESLNRMVAESTPDNLVSTSSSLLNFFLNSQLFHQVIRDLAAHETALCGKNKDSALGNKQKGNQFYLTGDYSQALTCYSQALRLAPVDANDVDRNLVAVLYLNRASSLIKMGLLIECLRDCDRAIQVSPNYSKAWYRRGKVNTSLGNYQDAAHDLTIAQSMESSLSGKKQIESELNIMKDQRKRTSRIPVQHDEKLEMLYETPQVKLQCITTADKGRGMASQSDIPQATLLHREEPYAMIVLKQCRDTYCHYCLNELPPDAVPCTTCSIAIYCSQQCQAQAGGQRCNNHQKKHNISEKNSHDLEEHIAKITLGFNNNPDVEQFPEHMHECAGVNWPAVLPTDIVLAARFLVKHIKQNGGSLEVINTLGNLELSHSYSAMLPESKLEIHIYSIVLLCCLQYYHDYERSVNALSISQVVILISQIRVNSMAVVRIKSYDVNGLVPHFSGGSVTSSMEQFRVGQAIYMAGSLFNHSCQPNIHAYFLSRALLFRATEFVAAGCSLELSYGPQVGQSDCEDRQKFLLDKYYFQCNCRGCAEVNMSDLAVNAFHCVNQDCPGLVLRSVVDYEANKFDRFLQIPRKNSLEHNLEVHMFSDVDVNEVANISFEKKNCSLHIDPGCCLKCGSYSELDSLHVAVAKAWNCIKRLHDSIMSKEIPRATLADAVRSLSLLRSMLHAYNRRIAEAEDNLAQAYCLLGDLLSAKDHCKDSIKILEKLYDPNHIVIAYELVKLSSIQLSLGDCTVVDSINRVRAIFLRYYGSDAEVIFPHLQILQVEAGKFLEVRE